MHKAERFRRGVGDVGGASVMRDVRWGRATDKQRSTRCVALGSRSKKAPVSRLELYHCCLSCWGKTAIIEMTARFR